MKKGAGRFRLFKGGAERGQWRNFAWSGRQRPVAGGDVAHTALAAQPVEERGDRRKEMMLMSGSHV